MQRGGKGVCGRVYDNAEMLFGDIRQCQLIMKKNFSGEDFMIDGIKGQDQPKLDCMFFPCTMGDEIKVFDGLAPRAPEMSISNMFIGD